MISKLCSSMIFNFFSVIKCTIQYNRNKNASIELSPVLLPVRCSSCEKYSLQEWVDLSVYPHFDNIDAVAICSVYNVFRVVFISTFFTKTSTISLPWIPVWPGTYRMLTCACCVSSSRISQTLISEFRYLYWFVYRKSPCKWWRFHFSQSVMAL